jgi:Winged helix DNA-binding domain
MGTPFVSPAAAVGWLAAVQSQGYDEYFIGYAESRAVLDVSGAARAHAESDTLVLTHAVVVDTQVVGRWRRVLKTNAVVVEADLFTSLDDAAMSTVQSATERYGRFMALPATLQLLA